MKKPIDIFVYQIIPIARKVGYLKHLLLSFSIATIFCLPFVSAFNQLIELYGGSRYKLMLCVIPIIFIPTVFLTVGRVIYLAILKEIVVNRSIEPDFNPEEEPQELSQYLNKVTIKTIFKESFFSLINWGSGVTIAILVYLGLRIIV